ncbi:hypothetical protein FGIG_01493 [Fasciola gigantica]|uniref:Uncharacterized protein n=1 Tax=Fasciola gigantica TaxID=46835 RepID=A0A504YHJ7_FASGI|nr:hypothetical protein FGIG_01493 [Fasciola gigantica]
MVREVSTTIHSSQRASDAVDRLIDAINDGKVPVYDPHRYQLGIRDNSSLFKRREVCSYCPSSRVQGPKSRVRKVIEEFLEVARKRGLYSSSPPRNRYSSDAVPGCRSMQSKKCGWKSISCTQPVRYSSNCSQHEDSHKWQQLPFSSQFNRLYSPDTDSFPQSSSPDLFEINEHVASSASTTDATFVDQSKNDFCCVPYESTYFASQPPYRVKEQTKRVSHPWDSNFWLSSQPDLQPFLQSSAYRGPNSHETEIMNPLLTRAESNLKSTSQWNTNESSNPSHNAASIAETGGVTRKRIPVYQ